MKKEKFKKKCLLAGILFTMALAPVITDGGSIADMGITAQAAEKKYKYYVDKDGVLLYCNYKGEFYLPDSVSAIEKDALDESDITAFKVSAANRYFTTIDGVLFSKDGKRLVRVPSGRAGSYTVPGRVTGIAQNAFRNCRKISSVHIPESVKVVGSHCFEGCKGLKKIKLPSGLTRLGEGMFQYCSSLKKLEIPQKVEKIGILAFYGCSSMESISLPSKLESIPRGAFEACTSLKKICLPEELKEIGAGAFNDCTSLASIEFNQKLEYIREEAFKNCTSLEELVLPDSMEALSEYSFKNCTSLKNVYIPKSLEEISLKAFEDSAEAFYVDQENEKYSSLDGVLFNKDQTELIRYPYSKKGDYQIPESVEKLNEAFTGCIGLETVTVPEKIKTLSIGGFFCSSVKKLVLPASLNRLYDAGCVESLKKLEEVEISPENKKFAVFDRALYSKDLKVLYLYPQGAKGTVTFPKEAEQLPYISPDNQAESFKVEKGSKYFASDNGVLTDLEKTCVHAIPAKMTSYTLGRKMRNVEAFRDAKPYLSELEAFKVKRGNDSFKAVDGVLFNRSLSQLIEYPNAKKGEFTISGKVSSIWDKEAFSYNSGLTCLKIASGLEECDLPFVNCPNLTELYINDAALREAELYFQGSTKLEKLEISSYLENLEVDLSPQCKERLTIYACSKTRAEKIAKEEGIPFKSIGKNPGRVKNVSVHPFIDPKYVQIRWSQVANADGYEIYVENGKIKDFPDPGKIKTEIYVGVHQMELNIRAYINVNGRKIYGESSRVVYPD